MQQLIYVKAPDVIFVVGSVAAAVACYCAQSIAKNIVLVITAFK